MFWTEQKKDWTVKDQEGMIPWERQLTKQITEYTQWESDETREIKGSGPRGPSEAFRGERLQPGSPQHSQLLPGPGAHPVTKPLLSGKTTARRGREQKAFNWGGERAALWTPNASSRLGHAFSFPSSLPTRWWPRSPGLLNRHCWSFGFSPASGPEPSFRLFAIPPWACYGPVSWVLSLPSLHQDVPIRVPPPQTLPGDWASNLIIQ